MCGLPNRYDSAIAHASLARWHRWCWPTEDHLCLAKLYDRCSGANTLGGPRRCRERDCGFITWRESAKLGSGNEGGREVTENERGWFRWWSIDDLSRDLQLDFGCGDRSIIRPQHGSPETRWVASCIVPLLRSRSPLTRPQPRNPLHPVRRGELGGRGALAIGVHWAAAVTRNSIPVKVAGLINWTLIGEHLDVGGPTTRCPRIRCNVTNRDGTSNVWDAGTID